MKEVLVSTDKQGMCNLRALGVKPGDRFLVRQTQQGAIIMEPCRVVKISQDEPRRDG